MYFYLSINHLAVTFMSNDWFFSHCLFISAWVYINISYKIKKFPLFSLHLEWPVLALWLATSHQKKKIKN